MHTRPLILLAAGGSTRMGSPKQLLPFRGSTLLQSAVETALASKCRPIVVVLGAAADRAKILLADVPVTTIVNADWQLGIGSSIRVGVDFVLAQQRPPAIAIMLCDQVAVTAPLLDRLIDVQSSGASIAASAYDGIAGVPAVIGDPWFDDLQTLDDSAGARHLFERHRESVVTVPFSLGSIDLDTPTDYQRWKTFQADALE